MIKKSLERDTVGWMEEKGGVDPDLGHVLLSSSDLLYIYHVLVTWGALSNQRSYHALLRSRGVSALAEDGLVELRSFDGERAKCRLRCLPTQLIKACMGHYIRVVQVSTLCCIFAALGWGLYIVGFALRINDR